MDFHEIVRAARRGAGLTQAALAQRVGTTQSAISRLERGHLSPTVRQLDRVLAACDTRLRIELESGEPLSATPGTTSKSTAKELFERDPVVEAYKKDVDRTLLRTNLARSIEDRVRNLMALERLAEEARRAGATRHR